MAKGRPPPAFLSKGKGRGQLFNKPTYERKAGTKTAPTVETPAPPAGMFKRGGKAK